MGVIQTSAQAIEIFVWQITIPCLFTESVEKVVASDYSKVVYD